MALDKSVLKSALKDLCDNLPSTRADAAAGWAAAYKAYAVGALSCGGGAPASASLDAAKTVLEAALLSAFAGTSSSATAAAMATALTAFWMTPPVAFLAPVPGVVTVVGGTAALQSGLASRWGSFASDSEAFAQSHSDIFDIFTKTVIVTHPFPVSCASPIT